MERKILGSNLAKAAKAALGTDTLRQSGITFGGTIINGALGAVFYILSARALGPSSFGIMSVALAVSMLASSIGDFGTDAGLTRFVSFYLKKNRQKANKFLKLTLEIKVVSGSLIGVFGFLASDILANQVFQKPEIAMGLKIAFVSVLFTLVYGFVVSTLKALQKFVLWSAIQIGANLVRVVVIVALFVFGLMSVEASLLTYLATLFAGFILGMLFFLPRDFLKAKEHGSVAGELFNYNKWIAIFTLVAALSSRLDTFIAARLLTSTELGIYSAANQLVYIVPQIIGALGTVFAPKMAEMESSKVVPYLKKTQLMVIGLALLGVLAAPVVAYFVPSIFGSQYIGAIPPFYVLLVAMLVFLISVPVHNAILFYYANPRLFFWLSLGHLAIMGGLGWVLISNFGVMGAAFTVLAGTIFNFIVPSVWLLKKIKE